MAYLRDRLGDDLSGYAFADADEIAKQVLAAFKPPPKMSCDEWAEKRRRLSQESSASPGRFRLSKTPFMREPMTLVGKPGVESIAMMCSAQVGKSTFVENVLGYYADLDPCPILHISPTLDSMKMLSKERLAPMIRDTPVLRDKFRDARTRDSGNTIASKKFPGGHIAMVGSNSPAGLASRPIRVLLADEVDRFERSAGTEGDPLELGIKRTTTYWNSTKIFVSTPGDKYDPLEKTGSRIEKEFLEGDQRHYHAKCPHCGELQKMKWANVAWDKDDNGNHDSDTAYYTCEHNGCVWSELDRKKAMSEEWGAVWIADKPFKGKASFCLSQLHSLFAPLKDMVSSFLSSRHDPMLFKTFVNTFWGEPWEDKGKRVDWSGLQDQITDYNTTDDIPEDITVITAAVDVQDDRLEYEIMGWGENYQSWSLKYDSIFADDNLSEARPWSELDKVLKQTFIHPLFGEIPIRVACIDSGGGYTKSVYDFCKHRPRAMAIKGVSGFDKPVVGKPMKKTIDNARVFPLGVDSIKQTVAGRLKVDDVDKGGYCRWPEHKSYGDDYFKMITAEELKTRFTRGKKRKEWTPIRKRNEAFDIRVYNTAALEMLSLDLASERRRLLRKAKKRDSPPKKKPKPKARPKSSWAESWKDG